MIAGVSTACLYPKPLEESLYDLAVNGVSCVEIFVNTHSELKTGFAHGAENLMKRFDVKCVSVHPFTCEMESMMFFSDYERRMNDMLDYYKYYFRFMNIVGADIFVFHGGKPSSTLNEELYCERYSKLYRLGKEFGVTVAVENVARCKSASSVFIRNISGMLGDEFAFVLDTKQAIRAGETGRLSPDRQRKIRLQAFLCQAKQPEPAVQHSFRALPQRIYRNKRPYIKL